jgi:Rod binding domain-containing protein
MKAPVPITAAHTDPAGQVRRLEALRNDPTKLAEAARGFEAMILTELLKPLEQCGGMLGQSMGSKFARDMFHEAISGKVADAGGLGLADMIVEQMSRAGAVSAYQSLVGATGAAPATQLAWPVHGGGLEQICSGFGPRSDPFTHATRMHRGIDIDAEAGTPVYPVAEGRVVFAGTRGGYGTMVIVEHRDGFETRYAHLDEVEVADGDWLDGSQTLGSVGSTGRSTGPHLHLEVRQQGEARDPMSFLSGAWAKRTQEAGDSSDEPQQAMSQASQEAASQEGSSP